MKILLFRLLLIVVVLYSPLCPAENTTENTSENTDKNKSPVILPATEPKADDNKEAIQINTNPAAFDYRVLSTEELLQSGETPGLGFLNTPHSVVSGGVETLAKYMDIFFADEKIYAEATKSYAVFSHQFIMDEHGESSNVGRLKLKIDLPKTKKKLKLLLESDPETIQTGVERQGQDSQTRTATESSYYAALQRELVKLRNWKFYSSLGMKVNEPLDPFLRFRASRRFQFAKWNMHFSETLFLFDSLGTGAATLVEFDRKIGDNSLFRSISSAIWHDKTDDYELKQSFNLYHEISKHRAVSLTIEAFGVSKPTIHSTSYLTYFRYRQRIHKDWLFYEIRPEVLYERENNFHPSPSLILQLDMVFGENYARNNYKTEQLEEEDVEDNTDD